MEISKNLLIYLQIGASLLMIAAVVFAWIMRRRQALGHLQVYAIIGSAVILNFAMQLPGRALTGMDGLIIVLDLVGITAWLLGLNIVIWRTESKRSEQAPNTDAEERQQ